MKSWRDEVKLSQKDAATHLCIPVRTYQDYERDVRLPGAESMEAFVHAGINANWLLSGHGPMLWEETLINARAGRDSAGVIESRWAIAKYALGKVEHHWFVTSTAEPDHALNSIVDDYNAGRIFPSDHRRFQTITIDELAAWGREAIAWADRWRNSGLRFPGATPQPPAIPKINVEALAQTLAAVLSTAPEGESREQSAHKAVQFYMQMMERGLITPDGVGDGNLDVAA